MFKIQKYEKLNSTNKYALENILKIDGNTVISAETQDAGRGRFSRKWVSDKKDNCYISFVLKPDIKYQKNFPNITQYLSIILCRTLKTYGVIPSIKWPNDVQINGKKIAGILSEISFENSIFNGLVLGIGVNLNLEKADLESIDIPATSLNIEVNQKINSEKFISDLVKNFYKEYEILLEKGFSHFRAEYISYCNFLGKEITIKNPEPQNLGKAINISEDGTLELLKQNGEIIKIISGDVILN